MSKGQPLGYELPECESCAALRAQVEALRQENSLMAAHQGINNYQRLLEQVSDLTAQLAAVTQERDASQKIVQEIAAGLPPMEALTHGLGMVIKLELQLATAQARIAELEQERDEWHVNATHHYEAEKILEQQLAAAEKRWHDACTHDSDLAQAKEAKFGAVLKDVRETLRQIVTISLLADNSPKQNAARECGAEAKALLARLKEAQP